MHPSFQKAGEKVKRDEKNERIGWRDFWFTDIIHNGRDLVWMKKIQILKS